MIKLSLERKRRFLDFKSNGTTDFWARYVSPGMQVDTLNGLCIEWSGIMAIRIDHLDN